MASTPLRLQPGRIVNHASQLLRGNSIGVVARAQGNYKAFRTSSACQISAPEAQGSESSTADKPLVVVEKVTMSNVITTIGINRPEKRNCVNNATAVALDEAFRAFEEDPESSVAVLYGKGGTFCAGYDLSEVASGTVDILKSEHFNPFNQKGLGPMGPSRRYFKKPVIAAVSGYAVSGGLELALMCDARVMEDTAVMGVFCRRFGVPLIDGGTVRLPRLIGLSRAMDLILTGRAVKGKEALEIGLANWLVACGTSLGQAIQYANSIAKFPQECLNRDRLSAYNATYDAKDFESALQHEMNKALDVLASESVTGAKTFVEGVGRHGSFNLHGLGAKKSKL